MATEKYYRNRRETHTEGFAFDAKKKTETQRHKTNYTLIGNLKNYILYYQQNLSWFFHIKWEFLYHILITLLFVFKIAFADRKNYYNTCNLSKMQISD